MLAWWGRFVYRHRRLVLACSGVALAASAAILALNHPVFNDDQVPPTEAGAARQLLAAELPRSQGAQVTFIFSSPDLKASDPLFAAALQDALQPLRTDRRVSGIHTPYDTPGKVNSTMVSSDKHRAVAVVTLRDDLGSAVAYYPELRKEVSSSSLEVVAGGPAEAQRDIDEIVASDLKLSESISVPLSLLLLLAVFGTLVAALLPAGVGGFAILSGTAAVFLLARATDVSSYALNVISLIGLGVAIDYSLFVVSRFREELAREPNVEEALARALSTAGRAICFSGLTVAIGLGGLLFFQGTVLAMMGAGGALVVLLAVTYALTFLSALLALLGPRVNRLQVPALGQSLHGEPGRFWAGTARRVMSHPWLALLPALAIVVALGSPFLHLRLTHLGVDGLPRSAQARQADTLLKSQFPKQEKTQLYVVLDFADGSPLSTDHVAAIYGLSQDLAALPDVSSVDGIASALPAGATAADYSAFYAKPRASQPAAIQRLLRNTVGKHAVLLTVNTSLADYSDAADALVRRIRALQPSAGRLLVTGASADNLDTVAYVTSRAPAAVVFVAGMTVLLLFTLLGSVVLPLKAVAMNALSISASFGAMVWIFQDGHLSGPLNFTPQPIDPTLPILLFCVVFGLSMDYEILLLTRIKEDYEVAGDNTAAVASGLAHCARLITGAAAIMVLVFLAFGFAQVVAVKALGLGLAIAVAVDATLVRAVIVPASMRLLGKANWWAPRYVVRLRQRLRLADLAAEA